MTIEREQSIFKKVLALWAKNSHLAGLFGPAKVLRRLKAAQEHELALWASQRSLAAGGGSIFGCDQRSQHSPRYRKKYKRVIYFQSNIEPPPAARDLWLAQRASSCSWAAFSLLRTLAGPNRPARWLFLAQRAENISTHFWVLNALKG